MDSGKTTPYIFSGPTWSLSHLWRYLLALAIVGVICGLIGAFFTVLISGIEHVVFGFTTGTFAEAVTQVSALHRFAVIVIAGIIVSALWYVLRRHGPHIPTPSEIYAGERIPGRWMLADTTLQVINVAAGGSIGREGAPRQVGALYGAKAASLLGLDESSCRILIACGAGAGLAAIYNVPLGGTLFAVDVVIGLHVLRQRISSSLTIILSALIASFIATLVARIAVPDRPTYSTDGLAFDIPLLFIAMLLGPLAGAAGYGFSLAMERVRSLAPKGRTILWTMPLCYLLVAALAIPLPLILGNGHAMAHSIFIEQVPLTLAVLLLIAKPLATLLTVRAGATGGNLTPSLSTGAALGLVVAGLLSTTLPVSLTAAAILGAAAFLAGAMRAPLTAGILTLEFTGADSLLWTPAAITIIGAWLTSLFLTHLRSTNPPASKR